MAEMSYLSVIERYHEYQQAIQELLASIVTGITDASLCTDENALPDAIRSISEHYPFVDHLYMLDKEGNQISYVLNNKGKPAKTGTAIGTDRSQRPYFQLIKSKKKTSVCEPYFSSLGDKLCISAITPCKSQKVDAYLVADIDLREIIEFLMGDTLRGRFNPLFKVVYTVISVGLFAVVCVLLFSAFRELLTLFSGNYVEKDFYLKPFSVIVFLTLAMAVFDLGKTTLEEEVLMHKDIFRHSSTRRTITRFISAVLIAVSIEALLMMFKSALGDGKYLQDAVWMMFSAIGLLVGLGVYVYLGARAESMLKTVSPKKRRP